MSVVFAGFNLEFEQGLFHGSFYRYFKPFLLYSFFIPLNASEKRRGIKEGIKRSIEKKWFKQVFVHGSDVMVSLLLNLNRCRIVYQVFCQLDETILFNNTLKISFY